MGQKDRPTDVVEELDGNWVLLNESSSYVTAFLLAADAGLFNAMFEFPGSWQKDAANTKTLAFDGVFITLYTVAMEKTHMILSDHVVVPSWDLAALARFIEKFGTHIIVGVKMGGNDVIFMKQQHSSSLQPSDVQKWLKTIADKRFVDASGQYGMDSVQTYQNDKLSDKKIGLPPKPSLRGNNWVVDATHCQGCSSHFTFINRKHHCRRCGGIFCSSCTQLRMVLRGQGDSPVRICEPCKKLEEAARFEMRHGHKSRAGSGGLKLTPKYEDEVLNKILGNDEQESASFGQESINKMLSSSQRSSSSASCSNIQEAITHDERGEILRSLSVGVTEMGSTTPDELRQQALDEKKKYKTLKAEGKSEEALRAFKRGKELERQAGALDLQLRKSRRMASSSMNMNEISKTKDGTGESLKINKHSPEMTKDKDDLAAELKSLGWSDLELRNADKKPVSMSLEGELSSLGEVSQKTNTKKVAHGSDKSQVIALKKNALALKREGKLAEAKEELKRAKILEKQIEEQEFLVDADDSDEELSSLIRSMDSHKQNDFSFGDVPATNFNFDNLVDITDGLVVDNFEVTDEDMDDPEMTAALESLGWTEDTKDTADNEPQSVPINREILLAEIQSLEREALNQKRAGNTAEALTLLKKAKVIEGDLGSYNFLGTNLNAHGSTIVPKDSLLHSAGMLTPNLVDVRKPDERKDAHPILAPKSKLMIQRELLALKKRALALRREGKLDEADKELKKGKALEQQLEDMDQTSKVKVTQVNNSFKDATTSAVLDVADEEEDVTEQDMHDPSYTSLLRNLGWKDEENGNFQSPPKENVNTAMLTSDSSVTRVHTGIQLGAPRSKGEIQRELLGLKRKSLALRRQGEAEEAEEVLKMAKVLEAQLLEMEAPKPEVTAEINELQKDESNQSSVKIAVDDAGVAGFLLEGNTARPSQNRSFTEDLGTVYKVTSGKRDEIVGVNENYSIDESNSAQVMVSHNNQSSPQQEILAHKRRAVTLKREGKLVEAKEELRQAKLLERSLEDTNRKPSTSSSDVSSSNDASIVHKDNSSILAPKLSSRDRFKLQQESLSHKRQALKLRREGKTAEAEAEFELAKALETQLEELTANDPNKLSGNSADPVDDVGVEDFLDPQLLSALKAIGLDDGPNVSGGSERPEPLKSVAGKIDNSSEERIQLEDRIKAEKVKAVNLKRLGKQAEAMDALRRAKMLEKKLNSLAL